MPIAPPLVQDRLLAAFRRAHARVPAYRTILQEHRLIPDAIADLESFTRLCPILSKSNTFARFPIHELCVDGTLGDLADVLTSSGHGGQFSFGLTSRSDAALSTDFTDRALDAAFEVACRKTLAINCLPMGVGFSSNCMTVATTSVREDMAVALVETFGAYFAQILLVGDPLFMNRLTAHAAAAGLDWTRYRVNVVIGEEIFGERFRGYLASRLGLDPDRAEGGYILSSFGVGELGLHLCHETRATIALRRAAFRNPALARDLFGEDDERAPLPMIFTFSPLRTFIEAVACDGAGYGRMTVSMLDPELPVPLLRYQTGDIVRLLDPGHVADAARRHGVVLAHALPPELLALRGRQKEALPNGSHVGVYKEALYADHAAASHLTGAFRVVDAGEGCTLHVQLAAEASPPVSIEQSIVRALPPAARPDRVVVWPYARFPYGMGLDYERKFTYHEGHEGS